MNLPNIFSYQDKVTYKTSSQKSCHYQIKIKLHRPFCNHAIIKVHPTFSYIVTHHIHPDNPYIRAHFSQMRIWVNIPSYLHSNPGFKALFLFEAIRERVKCFIHFGGTLGKVSNLGS